MNPSLAVCIPTYNRSVLLEKSLLALVPEVSPYRVPIYVSDNHSSDDTMKMLRNFRDKWYSLLFFDTNVENVGFDRNLLKVVSMASQAEYVMLMGDDDVVLPGIIERVMEKIRLGFCLIVTSVMSCNVDLTEEVLSKRSTLSTPQELVFRAGDYDRLLVLMAHRLTFVSGIIVKRSLWDAVDPEQGIDTDFVHVWIILSGLGPGCPSVYLNEILIKNRMGNSHWIPRHFEVWHTYWPKIIWGLPSCYSETAKRKTEFMGGVGATLLAFVRLRAGGDYNMDVFRRFYRRPSKVIMFAAEAIARFPYKPLRTLLELYTTIWCFLGLKERDLGGGPCRSIFRQRTRKGEAGL